MVSRLPLLGRTLAVRLSLVDPFHCLTWCPSVPTFLVSTAFSLLYALCPLCPLCSLLSALSALLSFRSRAGAGARQGSRGRRRRHDSCAGAGHGRGGGGAATEGVGLTRLKPLPRHLLRPGMKCDIQCVSLHLSPFIFCFGFSLVFCFVFWCSALLLLALRAARSSLRLRSARTRAGNTHIYFLTHRIPLAPMKHFVEFTY